MTTALSVSQALEFVRAHGIVLVSAKGSAPRLIDAILGEAIAGNWWAHPGANPIYNVLSEVTDSEDILVCRLLKGKVTLVHRRLWPALVRAAPNFEPSQLAQVREEHTSTGRHVTREVPFPAWVPPLVQKEAELLSEKDAFASLGPAVSEAQAAQSAQAALKPHRKASGT
jgi:hypothetical protein